MTRGAGVPVGLRVAIALGVLYAVAAVLWYGATPMGRMPVLDGREMTDLVRAIASGALPPEPFYRAPLYPALLALPVAAGLDPVAIPDAARALNLAAHVLSAFLVALLARRFGATAAGAAAAALAWLVYPVALHFAGDPLDIGFGIALALGGSVLAVQALEDPRGVRRAAAAGLVLALATLARPQFLAPLVAWGVVLAALARGGHAARAVAFAASAAVVLVAMGCVNLRVGGEFRVLPWQGAYALWAANRPESNHRHYTQVEQVRDVDRNDNPMRLEAEVLYRRETGATTLDVAAMNRHWSRRMRERALAEPLAVARGVAQHAFHLVHDAESYDIKTYAYHKAESPWLRPNPLGFGLVLLAAVGGLFAGADTRARRAHLLALAFYVGGSVLFIVTDRYRLPVVALLLPVAAAALRADARWWRRPAALLALAAAAAVTYFPLPRGEIETTFVQDELLAAQAAGDVGDHALSEALARRAIAREPERSIGWELVCNARYNALWAALPDAPPDAAWERDARAACGHPAVRASQARALGTVFAWRGGDRDAARATWRELAAGGTPGAPWARAFLVAIGDERVDAATPASDHLALEIARASRGDAAAHARLAAVYGALSVARELRRMESLVGAAAP